MTTFDTTYPRAGAWYLSDQRFSDVSWAYSGVTMSWDLRHRRSSLVIRLLLAVWITVVVVVLCATGRWWGVRRSPGS
jgi:hypothetical protein